MSMNQVTDEGCSQITKALKLGKCALKKLNLSSNKLTNRAALDLSGAVKIMKYFKNSLNELDLSNNLI